VLFEDAAWHDHNRTGPIEVSDLFDVEFCDSQHLRCDRLHTHNYAQRESCTQTITTTPKLHLLIRRRSVACVPRLLHSRDIGVS
jgi:hypothetical protein